MDAISKTNRARWNDLANANVEYSRPFMNFTVEEAKEYVYRHCILKNVAGMQVLCLASGGGQDSVAFGLLGADVTVLDLSDVQLQRDRQAASHHGLHIKTIQGDMRDLSVFPDNQFDIVWQMYSINFIPSVEPVFAEVRRVLKSGGIYFLQFANPFSIGIDEEKWDGYAYPITGLYVEGEDLSERFPDWDVKQPDGSLVKLLSPHEFRHTLGGVLNGLTARDFILLGLWEWMKNDEDSQPGSWAHFTQVIPPWFRTFWQLGKKD
jgi:ubiquinone/menaquinone biosynthesis C-methylase UbiE